MSKLVYLVPLFPLIGFLINGLAYPKLSKKIAGIIGTIPPLAAFALSLQIFLNFDGNAQIIPIADWIQVGELSIPLALQIDQLSIMMLSRNH